MIPVRIAKSLFGGELFEKKVPSEQVSIVLTWFEMLLQGLLGPLLLVVDSERDENQTKKLIRGLADLRWTADGGISEADMCEQRSRIKSLLPKITENIIIIQPREQHELCIVDIGCALKSSAHEWLEQSRKINSLVCKGFESPDLGHDDLRDPAILENQIRLMATSASQVRLVDPHICNALERKSPQSRLSLEWILQALLRPKRHFELAIQIVAQKPSLPHEAKTKSWEDAEKKKWIAKQESQSESKLEKLISSKAGYQSDMHKCEIAWCEERVLHARYIDSDIGGVIIDPGLDQIISVPISGPYRLDRRLLVRNSRRSDRARLNKTLSRAHPAKRLCVN